VGLAMPAAYALMKEHRTADAVLLKAGHGERVRGPSPSLRLTWRALTAWPLAVSSCAGDALQMARMNYSNTLTRAQQATTYGVMLTDQGTAQPLSRDHLPPYAPSELRVGACRARANCGYAGLWATWPQGSARGRRPAAGGRHLRDALAWLWVSCGTYTPHGLLSHRTHR